MFLRNKVSDINYSSPFLLLYTKVLEVLMWTIFFMFPVKTVYTEQPKKENIITIWHSYRGREQQAFEKSIKLIEESVPNVKIRTLNVPYEVYSDKIKNSIPRGHGPDLFIFAHELIGDWSRSGIISDFGICDKEQLKKIFLSETIQPLCLNQKLFALPLAFKSLALFYNTALIKKPPEFVDELVAMATKFTDRTKLKYGLVFQTDQLYHIFPFLTVFGGGIKDDSGNYNLLKSGNATGLAFVRDLVIKHRIVPEETNAATVTQFFNEGLAAFVINGPWFIGEISDKITFSVNILPSDRKSKERMKPFLTIEGIFLSAKSRNPEMAKKIAYLLATGEESAKIRFKEGFQCVARKLSNLNDDASLKAERILGGFYKQLPATIPMPNEPQMRSVWIPMKLAIGKVLRGEQEPELALAYSQKLFSIYTAPAPRKANSRFYILITGVILLLLSISIVKKAKKENTLVKIKKSFAFYIYLAPGMLATFLLVLIPFIVGASVSLFAHQEGKYTFVGLQNFVRILFSPDFKIFEPMNFYTTLLVTILWTVTNVLIHVTIGITLALLLEKPWTLMKPLLRILLIIPWAIPNYITALIWKGMFHKQLGTINALLGLIGVEPVSWFSRFTTAFSANLITNSWLGFPFMMVVTLGALQSIPKEIEESARVDGAGSWAIFWKIKFPLLRPALLPAVILGTIWTFNMFNIIYLVSGGEPGGATDILISEAYRWAFERHEQYGYASAYAVLIFGILFLMSKFQNKLLKTTSR